MLSEKLQEEYIKILKEELMPAMGCTEPIALAYAGAKAREVLGKIPERVVAKCSGNIIKNVRCVVIPNTDGMMGIESGVMAGIVGGDASKCMEVLLSMNAESIAKTREMIHAGVCEVEFLDSPVPLHIILELYAGEESSTIEIKHAHTNITKLTKNGEVIYENDEDDGSKYSYADRSLLSIEGIKQFADEVNLSLIRDMLDKQILCNMNIAYEGMSQDYGLGIGRIIKESYPESVVTRMKYYAAAASEARMGGCDMPVVINSGSGNQGITSSVPVIVYAREMNISQEKLYRALAFSNLLTIYQKEFIGKLSAFCGAVSASCSSGAAVTYLAGGTLEDIKNTIENTLADIPGIICDGAKVSCAAKIATCLDAALMAHYLAMNGKAYEASTGILKEEVGRTISSVGYIGREGMKQTDKEIIRIMLSK